MSLVQYKIIGRIDERPIDPSIARFYGKNPKTGKTEIVRAIHLATAYGVCRGNYRTYVMFKPERDLIGIDAGKVYLEEVQKPGGSLQFVYIDDAAEHADVIDFIRFNKMGGDKVNPQLRQNMDKAIQNLLGISQKQLELMSLTVPETLKVVPEPGDITRDEAQEEKLQ